SDLSFPWANSPSVPTEEILSQMRTADPPVRYLVGTPKGRLSKLEKELLDKPWRQARLGGQVKLLPKDGELYVFAESRDRLAKERSMRRRQLKWLWPRDVPWPEPPAQASSGTPLDYRGSPQYPDARHRAPSRGSPARARKTSARVRGRL